MPLFGDSLCHMCDCSIPENTSFFTHLPLNYTPNFCDIKNLLANLSSSSQHELFSLHEVNRLCMSSFPLTLMIFCVVLLCIYHCICIASLSFMYFCHHMRTNPNIYNYDRVQCENMVMAWRE